jgi:DNA-binding response OmpR family regulator
MPPLHRPSAPQRVIVVTAPDADLRRALRFLLRVEGYEVETLDSGEALVAATLDPADGLVVDQDLPGLSGLEALRLVRRGLGTPAVLLVDEASTQIRDGARKAEVRLLEKPFHGAQLLTALRDALRG